MAAIFTWKEYNGAGGTETDITNLNMGDLDQANIATPSDYPIMAGSNTFEKYVKGGFTGTFSTINNFRFYLSIGTIQANDHIYFNGQITSYTQPIKTDSTIATVDIPTTEPGTANVSIGGNLLGSLSAPGTSDYIVLQYSSAYASGVGQQGPFTYTFVYDEA